MRSLSRIQKTQRNFKLKGCFRVSRCFLRQTRLEFNFSKIYEFFQNLPTKHLQTKKRFGPFLRLFSAGCECFEECVSLFFLSPWVCRVKIKIRRWVLRINVTPSKLVETVNSAKSEPTSSCVEGRMKSECSWILFKIESKGVC